LGRSIGGKEKKNKKEGTPMWWEKQREEQIALGTQISDPRGGEKGKK